MSQTRDRLNVASLARMRDGAQPIAVANAGAGGGGGGGLAAWVLTESAPGVTLSLGAPYVYDAGAWAPLTSAFVGRRTVGVCVAVSSDPVGSTLLIAGELDRSGTAGARLFADAAGAITEVFPGNQTDETSAAPLVWAVGWQISATRALILPCDPYRPRLVTYCLTDGTTQSTIVVRESPTDSEA